MRQEDKLKEARKLYKTANKDQKYVLESLFPELAESEDERIRKELILFLKENLETGRAEETWSISGLERWIAWLEKQGEIDKVSYEIAEKEKREFVGDGFIKCYADFQDFKEGETYWLEYVGNDNYNVRSDNLLGKMYHITPCQLYTIFKKQTWLEKQGEQKSFDYENTPKEQKDFAPKSATEAIKEEKVDNANKVKQKDYSSIDPHFFKPVDKVKPKFKFGDWITNGACIIQITSVDDRYYWHDNDCVGGDIESIDKEYHLWTIEDAKDGDVLAFDDNTIVIFKDLYNATTFHSYCHIEDGLFDVSKDDMPDWWEGKGFQPATKEQRSILFSKMKEAGYEWDDEKKESKIIDRRIKYE